MIAEHSISGLVGSAMTGSCGAPVVLDRSFSQPVFCF